MKFIQAEKFSYLIQRKWFRVDPSEINGDLEATSHSYRRFLEATLAETSLAIVYFFVVFSLTFKVLDFNSNRKESITAITYNSTDFTVTNSLPDRQFFSKLLERSSSISFLLNSETFLKSNKSFVSIRFRKSIENCSAKASNSKLEHQVDSDFIDQIKCMQKCCLVDFESVAWRKVSAKLNNSGYVFVEVEASQSGVHMHFVDLTRQATFSSQCLVLFIVLSLYTLFYLIEELFELCHYRSGYFRYLLNFNDFCLTICNLVIVILVGRDFIWINYNLADQNISSVSFKNLSIQGEALLNTLAVALFLTWVKCFKFINVSSGLTLMNATLTSSFEYLICYLIIFASIYMTIGELMHRLFSQIIYACSTFFLSQFTVLKFLLAEVNMTFMYKNSNYEIVFLLFYFFVFIILSGIFLGIINDSYVHVLRNYERKPELDYYDVFIKTAWRNLDLFGKKKRYLLPKTTMKLIQDINNFERLDEALTASKLRNVLIKMNHSSVEIDAIFNQYNVNENDSENESPDAAEILLESDLCQEIIKRLDLSRNRINELNRKKLSFLKPVWYQSNAVQSTSEATLTSKSGSSFLSSVSLGEKSNYLNSCTTLQTEKTLENDEAIVHARQNFDNKFSEFITRRDYLRVKAELDGIELEMYALSERILKTCTEMKARQADENTLLDSNIKY
jgi:hypothetical protein